MNRIGRTKTMNHLLRALVVLCVALLAACATPGGPDKVVTTWDLGPLPAATAAAPTAAVAAPPPVALRAPGGAGSAGANASVGPGSGPGLVGRAAIGSTQIMRPPLARPVLMITNVEAPAWLDNHYVTYRLAYSDPLQPRAYAQARWSMPPAQLVQQRARALLSQGASVVAVGDVGQGLVLKIELDDFSQVFDSAEASRVNVQWRATLFNNGRLVAQRAFTASRPAPSANAAGAVRALATATDALLEELATWIAAPAGLRR